MSNHSEIMKCILQQVFNSSILNSPGSSSAAFLIPPIDSKGWKSAMDRHMEIFQTLNPDCPEDSEDVDCLERYLNDNERFIIEYITSNVEDVKDYASRLAEKLQEQAEQRYYDDEAAMKLLHAANQVKKCLSDAEVKQMQEDLPVEESYPDIGSEQMQEDLPVWEEMFPDIGSEQVQEGLPVWEEVFPDMGNEQVQESLPVWGVPFKS